jgi:hypothetical protein
MSLKTKVNLLQNETEEDSITPHEQQLEHRIAYNSSSKNSSPSIPSEQQVCTAGGNSKVEYTYVLVLSKCRNKMICKG